MVSVNNIAWKIWSKFCIINCISEILFVFFTTKKYDTTEFLLMQFFIYAILNSR